LGSTSSPLHTHGHSCHLRKCSIHAHGELTHDELMLMRWYAKPCQCNLSVLGQVSCAYTRYANFARNSGSTEGINQAALFFPSAGRRDSPTLAARRASRSSPLFPFFSQHRSEGINQAGLFFPSAGRRDSRICYFRNDLPKRHMMFVGLGACTADCAP